MSNDTTNIDNDNGAVVPIAAAQPQVLRRREAALAPRPPAAMGPADALVEKARLIAAAGADVLPKGFRSNPGACLMAVEWAERMGVSIFEAVGEISFVYGKPVISAVMQKRLAARQGYTVEVLESTETLCTVVVRQPDGSVSKPYTYTIGMAADLGLIENNDLYHKDPRQMLYKRATTRGLEHYGPPDLATVFQEGPPPGDALVEFLPPAPEEPDDDATEEEAAALAAGEEPHEPEAKEQTDEQAKAGTFNDVLAVAKDKRIKPARLRIAAKELGFPTKALAELAGNDAAVLALAKWVMDQPEPSDG